MTTRRRHRTRLLQDGDLLQVAIVAFFVCFFSAGLVYLAYFAHVFQVARRSACQPRRADTWLVFGKHAPGGQVDADFAARIERVIALWPSQRPRHLFLLGGGADGEMTEAEVAHQALAVHLPLAETCLHLEKESRDTLQNLRNARQLLQQLPEQGPVALLSSRYHLARCALFARQLGLDAETCAAEARLRWNLRTLRCLLGEAGYVCLLDIGTRWARLTGSARMLARVT